MTYSESIPKIITTNVTTKPSEPQIRIENPVDADIFVNLIEIIPTTDFVKKGNIEIYINDVVVLDRNDENFRVYSKFLLSLNKKLIRNRDIEIYAWNKIDNSEIKCDFNVHLSTEQQIIESSFEPQTEQTLIGVALSSATNTIYTCPTNKKAKINGSIFLDNYGAASYVSLRADNQDVESFYIDDGDAHSTSGTSWLQSQAYKTREIKDMQLSSGQILKKTQNIGDNATLRFALRIREERA